MQNLTFSNNDKMPVIGLGTWKSQPGEVYGAVKEAIKVGYRHIDCAPIYGNETEVGKALAESVSEGVAARKDIWVTSKLWNTHHAAADVKPALEKTLKDLQLDYLDLFLIHWPVSQQSFAVFPRTPEDLIPLEELPIAETWQAMEALVKEGLCKHIGVCNFSTKKLEALRQSANTPPEVNQIELHPYLQQPEMLAYCQEHGIHLTAYSPLGSPDRPSSVKAPDEPLLLEDATIAKIAKKHQATVGQVLISWAMHRGMSVIPKSVNPGRIAENLKAADLTLDAEDMEAIAQLEKGFRYVDGSFFAVEGSTYTLEGLWDSK